MVTKQKKTEKNLQDLLGKYQRAHLPSSIKVEISGHDLSYTFIPSWQMTSLCSWLIFTLSHPLKMNEVVGHFSTQTCVVLHPNNGTRASIHFSRSKNSKCGLSITLLSTPHFRRSESVGTSKRSKSPFTIAI